MKLGPFDGSTKEFNDLVENHGFNPENFLQDTKQNLNNIWIIIPIISFIIAFTFLTLFPPQNTDFQTLIFLLGCCAGIWLSVSVQIKSKNFYATSVVAIGSVLIMLVAIGLITPIEMVEHLKEIGK